MRLSPLPAEEWDERARSALSVGVPPERRNPTGAGNALSTLVRHPDLTRAYMPLSVHLKVGSTLPEHLREVLILRLADRTKCEYQLVHHIAIASSVGMTQSEITAAINGSTDDPLTRLVFAAIDELLGQFQVSEATWTALAEHLDEQACMDLVLTIAGYTMLAMWINSFGVEVEDAAWRASAHDGSAQN
jgi:4-carboxymuconolactone decarboxylase